MGVKVKGLRATIAGVSRRAINGSKAGEDELYRQAKIIARTARDYAPVKHGHLQSAQTIRAEPPKRAGIKFEVHVTMGGKDVTIGGKTRNVDEYLDIIHNKLGWKNLRKRSLAKGPNVDAFFLKRAAEDKEKEVIAAVSAAVKQGYRRRV